LKITIVFIISLLLFYSASGQKFIFKEDFNQSLGVNWKVVDDKPSYSGPSNWFIENEVLRQTSNIWAYPEPQEYTYHLGTHVFAGSSDWQNYTINAILKATDNDGIGILFRYQDEKNYYRFLLIEDGNNGGPKRKIQKFVNGEVFTLYEKVVEDAIPNGWFSVSIDVRNDSIKTFINGLQFNSVVDTTYSKGKIGLHCYAMSGAYFDSVYVSEDFFVFKQPENITDYKDRKPYVQLSTQTSAAVAWVTKTKSIGMLSYGTDIGNLFQISESEPANKHLIIAENLTPDTKYYYTVYNEGQLFADSLSFSTVKPREQDTISFLIWGDSGTDNADQHSVAKLINNETDNVDFAIHVGDVSQFSGEEYDNIYFSKYSRFVGNKNVYTAIGNHDTYYDGAQTYLNDFYYSIDPTVSERYYSFMWGNAFFICLDSNIDYSPDSEQYRFFINELGSDKRKSALWTIVYFHHPPYCELWEGWAGDQNVRDYLVPQFEAFDVDFVFNGHTHGYERGLLNGVYYIISGGGGGGLDYYARDWAHIAKSKSIHHYTKVNINGKSFELTAIDKDSIVVDKVSIYKNPTSVENISNTSSISRNDFKSHPNPFNNQFQVNFEIKESSNVEFTLYNSLGELVDILFSAYLEKGIHKFQYSNNRLSSGVYFAIMKTSKDIISKKIILMK